MNHILIPTDFSETADTALDFAINLVKFVPAKITLMHSFELNSNMFVDYMGANKEFNDSLLNDAKRRLEKYKANLPEGVIVNTMISTLELNQAIQKLVEEDHVDMVIMGTLGASGVKSKLWGSHTSSVIEKTKVPVLAVPSHYKWEKPQEILIATNKFERDKKLLDFTFELAELLMAEVHTAVFTNEKEDSAATFLKHEEEIADYGDFLIKEYKEDALTSTHLIGEKFEDTLQEFIEENGIDILTMITYQGGFWKNLFNSSFTQKMSFHLQVPLLAIPAGMGN